MKKNLLWTGVLVAAVALGACRPSAPASPTATQLDPNAVFTAAAQTAGARMTEMAAITDTPSPEPPTDTPLPPTATQGPITPTATLAPTNLPGAVDGAQYVADVTVPDGTNFQPDQDFTKTWQLKNTGTSTWSTSYLLVFVSGEHMNGPVSVPVPSQVAPGQTVNISVNLTAPSDPGQYTGYWRMSNANGTLFSTSVYVQINVPGSEVATNTGTPGTPTATNTPGPSPTPGTPTPSATSSSPGNVVSGLVLSIDNAEVEDTCPHTFTFTAQFTVNKASSITYKLDADTGFDITLPEPVTANFDVGTYTLVYTLDFSASVDGWARFHITDPADVTSNQANFTLTCN